MKTLRWDLLALAVIVGALAIVPLLVSENTASGLNTTAAFVIVAIGLNLFSGGTGQFSLGHAGFYAIGAFTAAYLMHQYTWPFWLAVPAGGLLAAVAGLVLGFPTLRLSGPYLAIATLGFGLLVQDAISRSDWLGGRMGISLSPPQIGGVVLSNHSFFWIMLAVTVVAAVVAHNLRRGATGRAFVALRESEPAAQASGVHVARYRITAFTISAAYAGLAGALFASTFQYVNAASYGLALSTTFVAMIVIGGLDSTIGAIVGAVFFSVVTQSSLVQDHPELAAGISGLIIIAVLLFLPGGLMGLVTIVRRQMGRGKTAPVVGVSRG